MTAAILVTNASSSSIKFAGYAAASVDQPEQIGKGQIEGIGSTPWLKTIT